MFIYTDCKMYFHSNVSLKGISWVTKSGSFAAVQNPCYELASE